MTTLRETWDWALSSPLVWLLATLVAYRFGLWLRARTGSHPLAQPVLVAVVVLVGLLLVTGVDYDVFRADTELIAFWLGPATVAFAIPLHRSVGALSGMVGALLAAVVVGVTVTVTSGYLLVEWLGGGEELALTMAPKTATTPVALVVSDVVGGVPALTAVFAVLAGILGAVFGPLVLDLCRIRDPRARGVAMGTVSHGVGTSRSLQESEVEGAVAGLVTGLAALAVSVITPYLVGWLG